MKPDRITILGATGSIGESTLAVLAEHPERYSVYALTAHRQADKLLDQCRRFRPRYAVLVDSTGASTLAAALKAEGLSTELLVGAEALVAVAEAPEVDQVMAAIVGAAGLPPTLAAAEAGKRVLLANKEALVVAGPLFMEAVRRGGGALLPIDSEHNALFQCMPPGYVAGQPPAGVRKLLLTGSGGPFRHRDPTTLGAVTPEEACAHPNWSMGQKISVDSATMMNKGLEFIEACLLFATPPSGIEVVIHPESVIHSLVAYEDGSVLAQLGPPDMRTPIAAGLSWPDRIDAGVSLLDLVAVGSLTFEAPSFERFPCLALALAAAERGGLAPAWLNAANEVAVAAFLARRIGYLAIPAIIDRVMQGATLAPAESLDAVLAADREARRAAEALLPIYAA